MKPLALAIALTLGTATARVTAEPTSGSPDRATPASPTPAALAATTAEPKSEETRPVPKRPKRRAEVRSAEASHAARQARVETVDPVTIKGRQMRPAAIVEIERIPVRFEVGTARYSLDGRTN